MHALEEEPLRHAIRYLHNKSSAYLLKIFYQIEPITYRSLSPSIHYERREKANRALKKYNFIENKVESPSEKR
jgi:hypothetical protein